jgi:hypothetical protein
MASSSSSSQPAPGDMLKNSLLSVGATPVQATLLSTLLPSLVKMNAGGTTANRSGGFSATAGYFCQHIHSVSLAFEKPGRYVCAELSGDIVVIDFHLSTGKPIITFISDKSGQADDFKKSVAQLTRAATDLVSSTAWISMAGKFEVVLKHQVCFSSTNASDPTAILTHYYAFCLQFFSNKPVSIAPKDESITVKGETFEFVQSYRSKEDLWNEACKVHLNFVAAAVCMLFI